MSEQNKTPWTQFMDMHSGGGTKEAPYEYIYIEAPQDEAVTIFYNRFGHNPNRVTCTCCGEDYSINESESLEEATAYERGCASGYVDSDGNELPEDTWERTPRELRKNLIFRYFERAKRPNEKFSWGQPHITLDEYLKKPKVLIIRADAIKPEERKGDVPDQGFVWV